MTKKIGTINEFVKERNKSKILFTAGPASLLEENIIGLRPCFGRADKDYDNVERRVLAKIKQISGQKQIARMQGSATLAIEIMSLNFLYGHVLIISTGYYSDRILSLAKSVKRKKKEIKKISVIDWRKLDDLTGNYDWVFACSTETSCGLKVPILDLKKFSKKVKAKLALDATASIGLESFHELGDVISYSSCKGLFGLTGGCFISYNSDPLNKVDSFNLNINSHIEKRMTGPYHSILSLEKILDKHKNFVYSVVVNKKKFLKIFEDKLVYNMKNQPLLCTYANCKIGTKDRRVIFYKPRINLTGSVVCHLGEVHLAKFAAGKILNKIYIKK